MEFQKRLVDALLLKQKEAGLGENDTAFSKLLQISRTTWLGVKNFHRTAGLEVLAPVLRKYPELGEVVLDYLKAYPGRRARKNG